MKLFFFISPYKILILNTENSNNQQSAKLCWQNLNTNTVITLDLFTDTI